MGLFHPEGSNFPSLDRKFKFNFQELRPGDKYILLHSGCGLLILCYHLNTGLLIR